MTTLSIIIPVYNGEKFLRKCLDSIFYHNVPLQLFEVIIVNDGTPDRSLDIVSRYTELYKNITVFSQENKGLGEARNSGIKLAKGQYIWFVDQDDWLTDNAVERICSFVRLNNPDILYFEYRYPTGKRSSITNNAKMGQTYTGKEFLKIHIVENPVWHYVIKSSFIREKKLFFYKKNHEDTLFTTVAFFLADSVMYDNSINYIYDLRENSLSTTLAALEHCHDINEVIRRLENFKTINAKKKSEKKIISKYITIAFSGLYHYWKRVDEIDKRNISESLPSGVLLKSLVLSLRIKYIIAFFIIKVKCLKLL